MRLTIRAMRFLVALPLVGCGVGTIEEDRTAVMVAGVVTNSLGVPVSGMRVRALSFVSGCEGTHHGEDAGVPRPTTDATGRYLLLLQSQLSPARACVRVTAIGPGAAVDTVIQQVAFRDVARDQLDTIAVDLRLEP